MPTGSQAAVTRGAIHGIRVLECKTRPRGFDPALEGHAQGEAVDRLEDAEIGISVVYCGYPNGSAEL